ncbi:DUF4838 domain-containing protein [Candidatus Bathyarchaeota archaeon]|nr:DUF4838 domain-containing protein [Candidatus Bathyarchaeota archaeon]
MSIVAKPTVLVDEGKSPYRIIIPADAVPSERYAAEELQKYLEHISVVKLPIVTDDQPMTQCEILLGDNKHLRSLGLQVDLAKLGSEGFLLRTFNGYLIIVGGRPRGTLYGVYTLLEEKLGVRWFTPEVEYVPKMTRVEIPPLNEMRKPVLEYREVFWTEMLQDADFAARHRLNGHHYQLTEKHGGRAVVFYPFVHSFDQLIHREICEQHPDFWPMVDGKRVSGYVQRCLSNSELVKIAIEQVRKWLKAHPDATIIDISQNDTGKWCQCSECKAFDDAEESPAASIIRFVNTIAESIERDYPNIRVETLAYQYSRKPPKTLRPRRNVIIRLCSIECCFSHPLESCPSEENRSFSEDIEAWRQLSPTLYVWDYTTNFAHYLQPFPNLEVLQSNVRFFVKQGVKGLFEQGNYSPGGNGEMAPLRAYVLAKLLWNPETDVQKHIDDFLNGYYGRAAHVIRAYIELLHRKVKEKKAHVHIFDPPTSPFLDDGFLEEAEKLFDKAEQLADNEEVHFRVQVARLPVWYVKLATNRVKGEKRLKLLRSFLEIARRAGITHISESMKLDDWAERMSKE